MGSCLSVEGVWSLGASSRPAAPALPRGPTQALAKARFRPFRFHDLRRTTASLLMMAGANVAAVEGILRHKDPRITREVYGHLAPDYLRSEIDRLRLTPQMPIPAEASAPLVAVGSAPLSPMVVQGAQEKQKGPDAIEGFPQPHQALHSARSRGLEPLTSGVTGRRSNQLN